MIKVIQMPDGKMFVVGEGYKRQASAGGIALNVLGALAGHAPELVLLKLLQQIW